MIEPQIAQQMTQRGWSEQTINGVIAHPIKTVVTRDTRWDPVSGSRLNEPATGYIARDGAYVIRNDRTGVIVEVSDRNSNGRTIWRNGRDGIATWEIAEVKTGAKVEEKVAERVAKTEGAKGSVTSAETVFKTAHYALRLELEGVNIAKAEYAVAKEVSAMRGSLATNADTVGRLKVDGVLVKYRARLLEDGTVNIGTIFPVK